MLNWGCQWQFYVGAGGAIAPQFLALHPPVAILEKKIFGGPGPSSFGRQPRLSKITIEPINSTKKFGGPGQDLGACAPLAQRRTATGTPSLTLLSAFFLFPLMGRPNQDGQPTYRTKGALAHCTPVLGLYRHPFRKCQHVKSAVVGSWNLESNLSHAIH